MKRFFISAFALCAIAVASNVRADAITGAYDTRTGDGSKTTVAGDTTGPWVLTSTDTTASWVRRYFDQTPTFASLTDLDVVFFSPDLNAQFNSDGALAQALNNAGGGGGAPRLTLALDSDGDSIADQFIDIHLGGATFTDSPTALNTYSGMNLIGNNDIGRYDLSQAGGSNYTDYNAALALIGSSKILRATVFVDSFGGADKTLDLTGIDSTFASSGVTSAVPLPASACTGIALIALLAAAKIIRVRPAAV